MTGVEWMDYGQKALGLGAAGFAAVRWVVLPRLAAYVRKVMAEETGELKTMERTLTLNEMRMQQLEGRVTEHDKVFEELPLFRQAIGEMRVSVDNLAKIVDRLFTKVFEDK